MRRVPRPRSLGTRDAGPARNAGGTPRSPPAAMRSATPKCRPRPSKGTDSFSATAGAMAADLSRATTPCRSADLYSDSSAVHVDFRTCNVGRLIGSQEQDGVRHLVNFSRPAHRNDAHAFGPHGRI